MKTRDFTTSLIVEQTPQEVFNAITNVRGWWSEAIEGGTAKLNDEFIYHYKDIHACKIRLTEVVPGKKIAWLVLENYFSFVKDKSEWKNTQLVFDITQSGDKTKIQFTHVGLVPEYECYNICEEAWTNYIKLSLRNLIVSGKGEPNPKEGEGYNTELAKKWKLE